MTDGAGKRDGPKGRDFDAWHSQAARRETATQNACEARPTEGASDLLREGEARFREFAEASSDVLWIRDAETLQWEYLSPAFEAVYGRSRESAAQAGDNLLRWSELIVPEDRRYALDCMSRARDGERISFEYRIKPQPDDAVRWLRSSAFPMTDEHRKVRRIGGIDRDISALKQAVDHRQRLHVELQHRVRNTLAVIRSIVRRTAESSETVEDFATHLDGRIDAFSRVQLAVTRDPLAGFDLAELISEELRTCAAREGERYALRGPPVRLKAKAAEDIALTVHELATNAVKHGAFSVALGRIDVRWKKELRGNETWLWLEWKESGMSGRPVEQRREGFGTILLRHSLRYDLGAEVTRVFEPGGFRCEIAFPLGSSAF